METSILTSTKKVLGIAEAYTAFDEDILMHINATFTILNQLGLGPIDGFFVEDDSVLWTDYDVPANHLSLVKTYVFLKVRLLFDPPGTSYLIEAMTKQTDEYEWRLNSLREDDIPWTEPVPIPIE